MDRLTWAEINLKNFTYNFTSVKKIVGPKVKIMAIVKANAYGHGAVGIARQAEKLKADYLGVVCLYEARQLRDAGIKIPILILNYTDSPSVGDVLDLNLTLNVMDTDVLRTVDRLARKKGKIAKIHVKIDSGMHRLGLLPSQALKFIPEIENYKNIKLEGIFTHFATADEKDLWFTKKQLTTFQNILDELRGKNISPPFIHAANSAAVLRLPSAYFNMVRPGIILYGLSPSHDFKLPFTPKPVMTLKSRVAQIRCIGRGETVGYGRTFKAKKKTLVGVIPCGYADGLRRGPTNWGFCLVRGKRVPIIGRVSMDQTSIDVTSILNVQAGDEVVLFGRQKSEEISVDEIAKRIGTINYEVVSSIAARVARKYLH